MPWRQKSPQAMWLNLAADESIARGMALVVRTLGGKRERADTVRIEESSHEFGVRHAHTEADTACSLCVKHGVTQPVEHQSRPDVIACVQLVEIVDLVATSLPAQA